MGGQTWPADKNNNNTKCQGCKTWGEGCSGVSSTMGTAEQLESATTAALMPRQQPSLLQQLGERRLASAIQGAFLGEFAPGRGMSSNTGHALNSKNDLTDLIRRLECGSGHWSTTLGHNGAVRRCRWHPTVPRWQGVIEQPPTHIKQ